MQTSRTLKICIALITLTLTAHAQDWRQLEKEKRYDEALTALETLAAANPGKQVQFLRSAADISLKYLKSPEKALAYADQLNDKAWSSFLRFTILLDSGRAEEALALLKKTPPESFPIETQTDTFRRIGLLYQKSGDTDQALAAFHRAIEAPGGGIGEWIWSCKYAADLHRARGETDKEIELYRLCLSKPVFLAGRNECLFAYVKHLAGVGNFTEAFAVLDAEKPVFDSREPDYWTARFGIEYARLLALSGERVKAIDAYDRAERHGASQVQITEIQKSRQALIDLLSSEL